MKKYSKGFDIKNWDSLILTKKEMKEVKEFFDLKTVYLDEVTYKIMKKIKEIQGRKNGTRINKTKKD